MNDILRWLATIVQGGWHFAFRYALNHPWAAGAALYALVRSFGVTIQSGQRGVLFRWGKAKSELEPGFHWLIPVLDAVKTTPVRSVTIVLADQKAMTADGLVYDVGVNVVYRVESATKALTLIDHLDQGCRAAMPIIVTEVLRVRDQAQLLDRASLDRELYERLNTWVARWGLVVEQAGFTTIAPNRNVLHTTQLRSKTLERAKALRVLIEGGLDTECALVMLGVERRPLGKSSQRYHLITRKPRQTTSVRWRKKKAPLPQAAVKAAHGTKPANPTATTATHG